MNADEVIKKYLQDRLDIAKCPYSVVDKCIIVSEKHPNEWPQEVLWPDLDGVTIFGHSQVAMGRENTIKLMEALIWTQLCDSMGDARKAIRGNAVRVNRKVVSDINYVLDGSMALPCDAIVLEFGKYNFGIIELC
jgi:tyrosyl-tRNA synthetase